VLCLKELRLYSLHVFEFRSGFWKFPETAWRPWVTRQATHVIEPSFLGFPMNCLEAEGERPGDVYCVANFLFLFDLYVALWCLIGGNCMKS